MITALLALVLAPAPVYVETIASTESRETRSLRAQLMLRLLEEGYPLAPSAEHATRTLYVTPTGGGLRVEARGLDIQAFEVATGPVLPLEAVHRAMQALDEVTPRAEPTAVPPPRFAVHVTDAPEATSAEAVRQALVDRLLAANGAVVPLDAKPDGVFCAEALGDDLSLSRGQSIEECGLQPAVVPMDDDQLDTAALDDSLEELMRDPDVVDLQPRDTTSTKPTPRDLETTTDQEPTPRSGKTRIRVGARAGIFGRISSADAAVGTSLRVGREPGPGGILDLAMLPTSAPDISIFETSVSGGFGWMFAVSPIVALRVQGLVGVQIHRFRQRGDQTGHRVDWTAEIPVGTSLRLARGLRLDLTVRGGRSGRDREHRVDDVIVWARSAWRIGASVGLSYGWRAR